MHKLPNDNAIKTDPEFRELIPPLLPEEFLQLEENIRQNGCRDALVVWKNTLIDGHNRLKICDKHGIPYETQPISFRNRAEALLWIIENQLGRRNLSDAARIELALEKAARTRSKTDRKAVAKDAGLCEQTVQRYLKIKEIADPKTRARLKAGQEKIGTVFRAYSITETKSICTPAELRKINAGFSAQALESLCKYASVIEKLYKSLIKNYGLINGDDIPEIQKHLRAHKRLAEGITLGIDSVW